MYVSIRDALLKETEFTSPAEGLRALGIEALEIELRKDSTAPVLDSYERVQLDTPDNARDYARRAQDLGLCVCGVLTARDFSKGARDENVDWLARAVDLAELLGAGAVRVDPLMIRGDELNFGERVDLLADGLGAVLDRSAGSSVALGIENHGRYGNSLSFLLGVFKRVESPRLGMTLDSGNFYWRGYPLSEVYTILEILAPFTKHTHLKNIRYPEDRREVERECGWEYGKYVAPLDEGDIDHARVFEILTAAGYQGDVCIEDESLHKHAPGEERRAILARDTAHVKELL